MNRETPIKMSSTENSIKLKAINAVCDFSATIGMFNIRIEHEEINRMINNDISNNLINLIKDIFDGMIDCPKNEIHYKEVIMMNEYLTKNLKFDGFMDFVEITKAFIELFMRRYMIEGSIDGKVGFTITQRKKEDNTFFNNTAKEFAYCQKNFKKNEEK